MFWKYLSGDEKQNFWTLYNSLPHLYCSIHNLWWCFIDRLVPPAALDPSARLREQLPVTTHHHLSPEYQQVTSWAWWISADPLDPDPCVLVCVIRVLQFYLHHIQLIENITLPSDLSDWNSEYLNLFDCSLDIHPPDWIKPLHAFCLDSVPFSFQSFSLKLKL